MTTFAAACLHTAASAEDPDSGLAADRCGQEVVEEPIICIRSSTPLMWGHAHGADLVRTNALGYAREMIAILQALKTPAFAAELIIQ